MLFKTITRPTWDVKRTPNTRKVEVVPVQVIATAPIDDGEKGEDGEASSQAELRRQMYERIAQGNALAEAEDHARRMWGG
jgi:hypothetical protein